MEIAKSGLMIVEFNGSFGKLLNNNEWKWSIPESELMIMDFNRYFKKLFEDNEWRRRLLKSGSTE